MQCMTARPEGAIRMIIDEEAGGEPSRSPSALIHCLGLFGRAISS